MSENRFLHLNRKLHELRPFLDQHSDDEIKTALGAEDFSTLVHLPVPVRHWLTASPDIWDDIWWYIEIRSDSELDDFPCVHIAYAMGPGWEKIIKKSNSVFSICTNEARTESVVISFCPWCAMPLNTDASR